MEINQGSKTYPKLILLEKIKKNKNKNLNY